MNMITKEQWNQIAIEINQPINYGIEGIYYFEHTSGSHFIIPLFIFKSKTLLDSRGQGIRTSIDVWPYVKNHFDRLSESSKTLVMAEILGQK